MVTVVANNFIVIQLKLRVNCRVTEMIPYTFSSSVLEAWQAFTAHLMSLTGSNPLQVGGGSTFS